MANGEPEALDLDEGDRLPWLEPAEGYDEDGVSLARIIGLVLLGLVLLGMIVGGGYWLKNREGSTGEARLIAAPGGDYKVPANDGAGKTFQGEGDTSFAASEGVETDGKIDASRMPEAPMADVSRGSIAKEEAAKPAGRPAASVSATVKDETRAKAASNTQAADASTGGALIQLGAYGSEAVARDGWAKLSKRFDYLASLAMRIEKAEVGGATLYRLRAGAGTAANATELCGRLKVAGENCIVVR